MSLVNHIQLSIDKLKPISSGTAAVGACQTIATEVNGELTKALAIVKGLVPNGLYPQLRALKIDPTQRWVVFSDRSYTAYRCVNEFNYDGKTPNHWGTYDDDNTNLIADEWGLIKDAVTRRNPPAKPALTFPRVRVCGSTNGSNFPTIIYVALSNDEVYQVGSGGAFMTPRRSACKYDEMQFGGSEELLTGTLFNNIVTMTKLLLNDVLAVSDPIGLNRMVRFYTRTTNVMSDCHSGPNQAKVFGISNISRTEVEANLRENAPYRFKKLSFSAIFEYVKAGFNFSNIL